MSTQGKFPDTLVLPFNTVSGTGCPPDIAENIREGNTFSVAFDMTQAPHAPGENGLVFLDTTAQSNFQAANRVQLSNEGLSDKIAFFSIASTPAMIFGEKYTVQSIFLSGTPNGDVFTWQTGLMIGSCIISNGPLASEVMAQLAASVEGTEA